MGLTIRDIAAICGVNPSTVSRALRDDPRVKPVTKAKIVALTRAHGYIPNVSARNLAAGKTNTVWFLLGSLENEIERIPALQLSRLLQENGYDLMMVLHRGHPEMFLRLVKKLTQKITDAAVIIPPGIRDETELRNLMTAIPVPVIFIDRWFDQLHCPVITTDNGFSARTLTQKCLDAGARIFMVYFPEANNVAKERKDAVCSLLASHGIEYYDETNFSAAVWTGHAGKPWAILSSTGITAVTAMSEQFGIEFNHRSLYGGFFDNWPQPTPAPFRRIFLCRQDFDGIATQAADLLVQMLSGATVSPDVFIKLPPQQFLEI